MHRIAIARRPQTGLPYEMPRGAAVEPCDGDLPTPVDLAPDKLGLFSPDIKALAAASGKSATALYAYHVGNSERKCLTRIFAVVRQFFCASLILSMKTGALAVCFAGAHEEENSVKTLIRGCRGNTPPRNFRSSRASSVDATNEIS
jgi:hypothetical protein